MLFNKPFIKRIRASNILSFGKVGLDIELRPLNVLIGANGSGKSNFLDLLLLAKHAPSDIQSVIRKGGGIMEWQWKGKEKEANSSLEILVNHPTMPTQDVKHSMVFGENSGRFQVIDERIENELPYNGYQDGVFYYRYYAGNPMVNAVVDATGGRTQRKLTKENIAPNLSVLSQLKDPEIYPELSYLVGIYDKISLYRDWTFSRDAPFRRPQPSDVRNDRLEADFNNLGVF